MDRIWLELSGFATHPRAAGVLRGLLIFVVGLALARFVSAALLRAFGRHTSPQQQMLVRRLSSYTIITLTLLATLREFGFDLSVLMGAAGILTVAIGFASQASASNIISGLFLIGERPFELGDLVQVGASEGEVISIDLLSVKVRTHDNRLVRIPNETLLKTDIVNLSRLPIRRFDLKVGVAYSSDLAVVKAALQAVAEQDPRALDEPAPWFVFEDFGDSALLCRFSVWSATVGFFEWRSSFRLRAQAALRAANVDIAFPHRTLVLGGQSGPLAVTVAPPLVTVAPPLVTVAPPPADSPQAATGGDRTSTVL